MLATTSGIKAPIDALALRQSMERPTEQVQNLSSSRPVPAAESLAKDVDESFSQLDT